MNRQEKTTKILKQANDHFASLILPQDNILAKLVAQKNNLVTTSEITRFNISQEIFKLRLYKWGSLSVGILLIIFLTGNGISYAADKAIPGDTLYPLDRQLENWHLIITRNPEKIGNLHLVYLQERADEWQKLKNKKDGVKLQNRQKEIFTELQNSYQKSVQAFAAQRLHYEQNALVTAPKIQNFESNIDKLGEMRIYIRQEMQGQAVNAIYFK